MPVIDQLHKTLRVEVHETVNSIDHDEWQCLFAGHPDTSQNVRLMESIGVEGFQFQSIVVWTERPIVFMPLFETRFPVSTAVNGRLKTVIKRLERYLPSVFCPRILAVGLVEGEWGQIGVDPSADLETLNDATALALATLERLSAKLKVDGIAFWNFTPESAALLPVDRLKEYSVVPSQPLAELAINYGSLDEYLASITDKDMRRYLKRVLRVSQSLEIIRTKEVEPWLERIYELYFEQVARSEMAFGLQSKEYFADVCKRVAGAEYVLYFAQGELLAFELLIANSCSDALTSKYLGLEPDKASPYKLYFRSWLENVQYCIDNGLSRIHLGAFNEALKCKLGASLTPAVILFKHRNPVVNLVLHRIKDLLAYQPDVDTAELRPSQEQAVPLLSFLSPTSLSNMAQVGNTSLPICTQSEHTP